MTVKTMRELFEHELKDMYYAENHLVQALEKMSAETQDSELKRAFASHKKETEEHVRRLERVFKMLGKNARPIMCHGIAGLIKEKQGFTKERAPKDINDFYNIGAGIKAERYEISAYESLIHLAREHLDFHEAAELFEMTLSEEHAALDRLHLMLDSHTRADINEAMPERLTS